MTDKATMAALGSTEGLGADELLSAFVAATQREALDAAESDVWGAVADKVAEGDMATVWAVLKLRLGDARHAVTAVLGLLEWLIGSGLVAAEHGVDETAIALPATCCQQMDAECIGIRLSKAHGTLWLEAPNKIWTERMGRVGLAHIERSSACPPELLPLPGASDAPLRAMVAPIWAA